MDPNDLISVSQFCDYHQIELSFVHSLNDYGLVEIITYETEPHLSLNNLPTLEVLIRLHNDLHINIEGIDAIHHLLNRIKELQQENQLLKNKLENH